MIFPNIFLAVKLLSNINLCYDPNERMIIRIFPAQSGTKTSSTTQRKIEDGSSPQSDSEEVRLKKKLNNECKERLGYKRLMEEFGSENKLCDIPGGRKGIPWTIREQMAWLLSYDTEPPYNRSCTDTSRWKLFSDRLAREFQVYRTPLQCRKQVMAALVLQN